jgi:hypothetical protein
MVLIDRHPIDAERNARSCPVIYPSLAPMALIAE